jgi:hypothetical protein
LCALKIQICMIMNHLNWLEILCWYRICSHHDIVEMLLKLALNTNQSVIDLWVILSDFTQSLCQFHNSIFFYYFSTYYHIVCMIYVRHKNALYSSIIRFEVKCMHFNQLKFVSLGLQFDLSWLNFFSLWNWHKVSMDINFKYLLLL